jgi:hypothetical protein
VAGIDAESPLFQALEDHLAKIRKKILDRAQEIASEAKDELSVTHLAAAIGEYAPGKQVLPTGEVVAKGGFFDYVPPVALLSAILAFAFAALGLWAILGQPDVKSGLGTQGFLDIAKIFAGAIVGSATTVVASGTRRGRG